MFKWFGTIFSLGAPDWVVIRSPFKAREKFTKKNNWRK